MVLSTHAQSHCVKLYSLNIQLYADNHSVKVYINVNKIFPGHSKGSIIKHELIVVYKFTHHTVILCSHDVGDVTKKTKLKILTKPLLYAW